MIGALPPRLGVAGKERRAWAPGAPVVIPSGSRQGPVFAGHHARIEHKSKRPRRCVNTVTRGLAGMEPVVDKCGTPELPFETEPEERWKPVVGWDGFYEVSDLGRVRGLDRYITRRYKDGREMQVFCRGRVLKQGLCGNLVKYPYVMLQRYGEYEIRKVHHLVLEAFVGLRPAGTECRHGEGGHLDNRLVNLCWGTKQENNGPDKLRDGHLYWGERHPNAKLTAETVAEIRRRRRAGESGASIGRDLGVSASYVNQLATGRHRAMDGAPDLTVPRRKQGRLTPGQVREICERYAAGGVTQQQLADEYGVSQSYVGYLARGTRRIDLLSA